MDYFFFQYLLLIETKKKKKEVNRQSKRITEVVFDPLLPARAEQGQKICQKEVSTSTCCSLLGILMACVIGKFSKNRMG